MTSLLCQNDVATSFWHNDDIIIASSVHWVCDSACVEGFLDDRNVINKPYFTANVLVLFSTTFVTH